MIKTKYDILPTSELLRHADNSDDPLVRALAKRLTELDGPLERWAVDVRVDINDAVRAQFQEEANKVLAVFEDKTLDRDGIFRKIDALLDVFPFADGLDKLIKETIKPTTQDLW